MKLETLASTLFAGCTLLMGLTPATAFAREHGSTSHSQRSAPAVRSSGGSRGSYSAPAYSAPRGSSGFSRSYVAPRSAPVIRGREYAAPRYYGSAPVYRGGYYRGGVYYNYYPGYAYDPGYYSYSYAPPPVQQGCAAGAYDAYGNWVPNPNCAPPPQNYYQDQQQYPQQQYQQQAPPPYGR